MCPENEFNKTLIVLNININDKIKIKINKNKLTNEYYLLYCKYVHNIFSKENIFVKYHKNREMLKEKKK